jgi:predicted RNA binding protein YcfA (HicA-like mRNA interferase family)
MARQSGSHVRLVKTDKRVTVPLHRSLTAGTLQSILRQAGITIEDLLDSL